MNKRGGNTTELRVLHITQYLEIGGLESVVIGLCRQLKKKGISVELICLNQIDDKYSAILKEENVPVHLMSQKGRLDFGFYRKIIAFVRKRNFNVVHAHSGCHLTAALLTTMAGVDNFIYTAHGMLIFTRLLDRLEDSLAGMLTTHLVSVSDEINTAMKQWLLFSRCRFSTIQNGIDTNRFCPLTDKVRKKQLRAKYNLSDNRIIFGSVGRMSAVKNYAMAFRAVKRLVDDGITNILFVLVGGVAVGEHTQQEHLRHLVKEFNLTSYICFLGAQYNIYEILPLFRFFVLSSLTEGTSISLLEALACGIPAVVTDVGGNSDVIREGIDGYLCPSEDDEKMALSMRKLIEDKELARKMGYQGRERVVSNYSIEVMAEKYLNIYTDSPSGL